MADFWRNVAAHYDRDIVAAGKEPQFFILVSFLLTFILVRIITHSIRRGRGRLFRNVTAGGKHIHHLVFGILLLLTTGYLSFAFDPDTFRNELAVLYGIGAALTLDEFALWLNLENVYWAKQGRASIDAVVIFGVILWLILVDQRFWSDVGGELGALLRLP